MKIIKGTVSGVSRLASLEEKLGQKIYTAPMSRKQKNSSPMGRGYG